MSVYVMSDAHGLKNLYDAMMKELSLRDEDTLYVLGDMIDRGADGIAILRDLMRRPNVKMLLGNHEYMMRQYYQALYEDMDEYLKREYITRWKHNGNRPTLEQFECLSKEQQEEILTYIAQLPLAYPDVEVKGRHYYLVHGCPQQGFFEDVVTRDMVSSHGCSVENFVWDRIEQGMPLFEDRCVIVGHTPTVFLQNNRPYAIWHDQKELEKSKLIDIDCGCAAANEHSRLAVLCLDDLSVLYF